jgi:hypothetical protein
MRHALRIYAVSTLLCAAGSLTGCGSPVAGDAAATAAADESDAAGAAQAKLDDDAELRHAAAYTGLAWGGAERTRTERHPWPVSVLSIGHTTASYQNYGGAPYFHHGLDIRADAGSDVRAATSGKVVNIENYDFGSAYWEVAILDPEGYLWQYHHVDHDSIPQAIFAAYRNGTEIDAGTKIGEVYYWSVVTMGERYHHIHLNVLGAGGVILNPFDFLEPLEDTSAPRFVEVGLLKNGRKYSARTVNGDYSVYATVHDLIHHQRFVVPPNYIGYRLDGGDEVRVWDFATLPGGASETQFVDKLFVASMVCGNYECRNLPIDLGFTVEGNRTFTRSLGAHSLEIIARDYAGNEARQTFDWQVN